MSEALNAFIEVKEVFFVFVRDPNKPYVNAWKVFYSSREQAARAHPDNEVFSGHYPVTTFRGYNRIIEDYING
jgi:hypothetical protein